jgi:hypothetical protein
MAERRRWVNLLGVWVAVRGVVWGRWGGKIMLELRGEGIVGWGGFLVGWKEGREWVGKVAW